MSTSTGVVKWYNSEKGYGFISGNNGEDIFVHRSSIKGGDNTSDLHEGTSVSFDVVDKEKGPMAINVQRI